MKKNFEGGYLCKRSHPVGKAGSDCHPHPRFRFRMLDPESDDLWKDKEAGDISGLLMREKSPLRLSSFDFHESWDVQRSEITQLQTFLSILDDDRQNAPKNVERRILNREILLLEEKIQEKDKQEEVDTSPSDSERQIVKQAKPKKSIEEEMSEQKRHLEHAFYFLKFAYVDESPCDLPQTAQKLGVPVILLESWISNKAQLLSYFKSCR